MIEIVRETQKSASHTDVEYELISVYSNGKWIMSTEEEETNYLLQSPDTLHISGSAIILEGEGDILSPKCGGPYTLRREGDKIVIWEGQEVVYINGTKHSYKLDKVGEFSFDEWVNAVSRFAESCSN